MGFSGVQSWNAKPIQAGGRHGKIRAFPDY
jgi:hypothetical protein